MVSIIFQLTERRRRRVSTTTAGQSVFENSNAPSPYLILIKYNQKIIQYIKDRTKESFEYYFPCQKKEL
jgi:hypothetical protein